MAEPLLRILQVNTSDAGGGAERISHGLFRGFRNRGHRSWLAVGRKVGSEDGLLQIPHTEGWIDAACHAVGDLLGGKARSLLHRLGRPQRLWNWWRGIEDFHFPGTSQLPYLPPERPDLLHCHNLHGHYFDLRALPGLSRMMPVVITLHDAWMLSGHCAHSLSCDRWRTGCGSCPDLSIPPAIRRDATAENWRRKQAIYASSRLFLTTPCRWLMARVQDSMLAPGVVAGRVIPNGVDLSLFKPGDRAAVRRELGIHLDAEVLLFTANGIRQNTWKDYRTLRKAVARLAEKRPVLFLALGESAPSERIGLGEIRFVPFEADARAVARYYQAADIYVHAAAADTFPTTVLEALACGIPVVATAVGGIPEQVRDGESGFLVPQGDAEAIASALERLLGDLEVRSRMGEAASVDARERFDAENQVTQYLDWYREVLDRWRAFDGTENAVYNRDAKLQYGPLAGRDD